MRRPPKKFTDRSQTEITADWLAWHAEQTEGLNDEVRNSAAMKGIPEQDIWPEDFGKDVGEGAWILVIEEPFTEMRARFRIPTPSLWWARAEADRRGGWGYGPRGARIAVPGPYRVVIETPGGSLWLFPHEYVVCQDPVPLITDPECTIHPLGGEASLNEDRQEELFYLQSRGISRTDALLMLMDGVDFSRWGWVEFPEYAREAFDGVGRMPRFVTRVEVVSNS